MATFWVAMEHSQKRIERERRCGARLLAAARPQSEVARRVRVTRQMVMRCKGLRQQRRLRPLRRAEHFGRPGRLPESQREELARLLKAESLAAEFATKLWTLPRIARLIEERFSVSMIPSSV